MLRIKLVVLIVVVICVQPLFAQQPMAESPKSKSRALGYSLVCTLAPIAASITLLGHGKEIGATNNVVGLTIGSLGLLCGPGMGHLYAKNPDRFALGMFIRGIAGTAAIYSISKFEIVIWGNNDHDNTGPVLGFVLGGSTLIVSAIYDISTTGKSVDRYNEQHGFSQFNLQPCYFADSEAAGLLLSMQF
jgi:hypothetical protein